MRDLTSVTAGLDAQTLSLLDRAALAHGLSREAYAAEAIRRSAEEEADFLAWVQPAINEANRGEFISQEEMEAWFEQRVADRQARTAG